MLEWILGIMEIVLKSMFNDRFSINAIVCQFVLLTLHSKGALDFTLALLNVHAYIKRTIERLLHLNEV